jgi:hypothetical protein
LAVYDLNNKVIKQLGTKDIPIVIPTNEGDGDNFIGVSDVGKRIESQWMGTTKKDIYAIAAATGERNWLKKNCLVSFILHQPENIFYGTTD